MSEVVGAFLVPHDPIMFHAPEGAGKEISARIWGAFDECADRMSRLRPTAVIIVGADHYLNFGTDCLPQYLIATGDIDGPLDVLPGLKREVMQGHQALATHIANHGHENGFDWAVARAFTVDHAVAIPDRLIVAKVRKLNPDLGTIPVYIASGVDPYISMKRCIALGEEIRKAVECAPGSERVVVVGSGGLSHWIGLPQMGKVNELFDRQIMEYACSGNLNAMAALTDDYILTNGGNGGMEVRQWAVAMGAMAGARGEVIEYAPVPEWVTGLGFVELFSRG
ncbi:protocatechuate 3,4-dioxygenase [Pusillimonas sp. DMV24BSW_D]|uniref:DODA-type extradiol aromatic ring-opening family dioxygenase n=1 Tax=Neopusillimonas aestuarii TaxID=2716226 RepID=UPI001407BDE7|nr:protocatechuate 3,4-dioxygenase [Pusillimonas sp. DMV24BSW_D]QIM47912.1 protocatechuate 3,4-dioxygenase [Pusillimonas sp. DMV24BSW_D]